MHDSESSIFISYFPGWSILRWSTQVPNEITISADLLNPLFDGYEKAMESESGLHCQVLEFQFLGNSPHRYSLPLY